MDKRTGTGGEGGKKRIGVTELDDLLFLHAQSVLGDAPELEDTDLETVDLGGYSLGYAFDLWKAWEDHHAMPKRGGYEDQPRRWRTLIHTMNRRYHFAYEQARALHDPNAPPRGRQDRDALDDYLDLSSPFDRSSAPSWERFGRDAK